MRQSIVRLLVPALILSCSLTAASYAQTAIPATAAPVAAPAPAIAAAAPTTPAAATPALSVRTPTQPTGDSLFTISDVTIDITADSAAHARDEAFADAERQAFATLAGRLSDRPAQDWKLADADIANLVQDIELTSERTSAVRYIGVFTIRFNPDSVRQMFSQSNVTYVSKQSPAALLLPIFSVDGRNILWEETTPWRTIWDKADLSHDLVPLILPAGTIEDASTISAADILSGASAPLEHIAARYNASEVAIAVLEAPKAGQTKANLAITLWRDSDGSGLLQPKPLKSSFLLPAPAKGPDDPDVLAAASAEVRALLAADWKQSNSSMEAAEASTSENPQTPTAQAEAGPISWLGVAAPVSSMADWLNIRRKLESTPDIRKINVDALDRTHANLTLQFSGDLPNLIKTLAMQGLVLDQPNGQSMWQLRPEGVAPAPSGAVTGSSSFLPSPKLQTLGSVPASSVHPIAVIGN